MKGRQQAGDTVASGAHLAGGVVIHHGCSTGRRSDVLRKGGRSSNEPRSPSTPPAQASSRGWSLLRGRGSRCRDHRDAEQQHHVPGRTMPT